MGHITCAPVTYPARILNTTQEECPPNHERESIRAVLGQDFRNILQSCLGKTYGSLLLYTTLLCSSLQELYVRTSPTLTMGKWLIKVLYGNVSGTVANYSCNAGYRLLGNAIRTCSSTGVWSGVAPTCQSKALNGMFISRTHVCTFLIAVGYSYHPIYECGLG